MSRGEVAAVVYSEGFAQKFKDGLQFDRDDPMGGFLKYRIARDETGAPIDQDGQSILDD